MRVRAPHSAHSSATTAPPSQPRERSSNIFIESPRQQQAEHLVVFPQQVGSDRRREACNTPKEVLVARWSLGVTALQQAFLDNLEHILDVALNFNLDCTGNSSECPYN